MTKFSLPYLDALTKVLEVVKRDSQHLKAEDGSEFEMKNQIENLLDAYANTDPDTAFQKINTLETNKKTLLEDVAFILKVHAIQARNLHHHPHRRFNFAEGLRLQHVMTKFQLERIGLGDWDMSPIALAFPDEEYKLKKENPSLCRGLPDEMKKYKNFKREYDVEGIVALLPKGKKYGGFIKAYINLHLQVLGTEHAELIFFGPQIFQKYLAKLRKIYNSSIFSHEQRIEWFEKLDIKENDCALWSRLFDQEYPGYKDVHKFFEQIA